jgi:hypothetical protein
MEILIYSTIIVLILALGISVFSLSEIIKHVPATKIVIKKEVEFISPEEVEEAIYEYEHIKKAVESLPDPNDYQCPYIHVNVSHFSLGSIANCGPTGWVTIRELKFDKRIDYEESERQRRLRYKWILRNRFAIR